MFKKVLLIIMLGIFFLIYTISRTDFKTCDTHVPPTGLNI